MGLDTYAYYGKGHDKYVEDGDNCLPDHIFKHVRLCGGIFSGGGASFRGKVYADFVEWVTGESLYSERIEHDVVVEMAKDFVKYEARGEKEFNRFCTETGNVWDLNYNETLDLAEWFVIAADNGAEIVGWY
jgi:hypothetical protein